MYCCYVVNANISGAFGGFTCVILICLDILPVTSSNSFLRRGFGIYTLRDCRRPILNIHSWTVWRSEFEAWTFGGWQWRMGFLGLRRFGVWRFQEVHILLAWCGRVGPLKETLDSGDSEGSVSGGSKESGLFGARRLEVWMLGARKLEVWMFGSLEMFGCWDLRMFGAWKDQL